MLKVENVEVLGWEHAIRGMRKAIVIMNVMNMINCQMIARKYICSMSIFQVPMTSIS